MKDNKRMKIIFVSHAADLYGAPRSLLLLLKQLNREKYDPLVVCPWQGPLVERIESLGIRVFIVPKWEPNSTRGILSWGKVLGRLRHIAKLIRILSHEGPDVVYVNTIAHASPIIAAKLCRLPIIVHVRESRSFFMGIKRKVRLFPIRYFPRRFIVVSQAIKELLVDQGIPESKISVVYNGVDLNEFSITLEEREQYREALALNTSDILVGTVGQINPRKGTVYFVEAANSVRKQMEDAVKFIIIGGSGNPSYSAKVGDLIARYDLNRHLILTGFKENVRGYLGAMDIFVNPTLEEPFARVNLEAMAMGKPIIATDVGGNPEAILDGETGFLIPPKDPDELAIKIMKLAANNELRQQLGNAARRRVENNFTASKYCKEVELILESSFRSEQIKEKRD